MTRAGPGDYCVHVAMPWIDVQSSIPDATFRDLDSTTARGGALRVQTKPAPGCGDDPQTLRVVAYDTNGRHVDRAFFVAIP
ncbi:hypothetical protein [Streptomyces sp. NPDC050264]|uniref:hypothetical protein n=1 Tax=Streptomyces sp. NPDC050264 TaxID=3155038 RepID=UPI003430DE1E